MKNILIAFACAAISGTCALGCEGFNPLDPTSTAPLDRATAKLGNSDCEKNREAIQKQVKDAHGKGSSNPALAGDWHCQPQGAGDVEVWHINDTGKTADGQLESWDDAKSQEKGFTPGVRQAFEGAHDGDNFIFFSEDPDVDFSGQLSLSGHGLTGKVVIRNGSSCQTFGYSCRRL